MVNFTPIKRYRPLTLTDILPYMGPYKVRNGETIGTCPCCAKSFHLYARQEQNKLLLWCFKCHDSNGYEDILRAFREKGAGHH